MTNLEEVIVGTAEGMYVCLVVSKYSKTFSDRPKGHSQTFITRNSHLMQLWGKEKQRFMTICDCTAKGRICIVSHYKSIV